MTTPTTPLKPNSTARHIWLLFKLGRICRVCYVVQPTSEFEDTSTCAADRTSALRAD
ncbi:MAG: hypothetical protein WEB52_05880 [Dehalococcoidia bacterium]